MENYKKINELLKPFNTSIDINEVVVTIDEEYGYRQHIWIPKMNSHKLEQWWKRQWNLDKCFGKYVRSFPGKIITLYEIDKQRNGFYDHIDFESELFKNQTWLYDNYYFSALCNAYDKLEKSRLCYKAHIFCNDDSWLKLPIHRKYIHHNGYHPAKLQIEKDIKELTNG